MLQTEWYVPLSEFERTLFERRAPKEHFLRQVVTIVDFERFRPTLMPME